jgi:hypothetical protein
LTINNLNISYPDFKLNEVIDPEHFDINNKEVIDKVNEIKVLVNKLTDGWTVTNADSTTTDKSGAELIDLNAIAPFASTKLQSFLQEVIDRLQSTTDASSGADFVASTTITGVTGSTVQAQLESLKVLLDDLQTQITSDKNALASHKSSATLDHPDGSVTNAKLANNSVSTAKIVDANVTTAKIADANITTVKLADASATDAKVGGRTADQSVAPTTTSTGTLTQLFSWVVNRIKAITGAVNWYDAPATTLKDTKAHMDNKINPHAVTASQVGAYSKTEMQTSGQSQLHWGNLTNVPAMADDSWEAPVALKTDLPTTGNVDGDLRIVLDEDTVYTWDGATLAWKVIGASGSGITDHGTLKGLADDDHLQYLRTDGTRALTGNQNFAQNQAINMVVENVISLPASPSVGQVVFHTGDNKFYVYKGSTSGWVDVSGKGAVIRDKEFVATAGQTVFDISDVGTYEVGTNAISVFNNKQLLRESEYTETSSTQIDLATGATSGDVVYIKWFENSPEVINNSVHADGTLQTNLNADMVDGKHYSDIQAYAISREAMEKLDQNGVEIHRSGKDANGKFTTVEVKRPDGTLFMKSVLSGTIDTNGNYPTRTESFYDEVGTTQIASVAYSRTFDVDGDLLTEVI